VDREDRPEVERTTVWNTNHPTQKKYFLLRKPAAKRLICRIVLQTDSFNSMELRAETAMMIPSDEGIISN
jgi:hypothetical protein